MPEIAATPEPPYYAVIFTSLRAAGGEDYAPTAARLMELAAVQPGFLGVESTRDDIGITVSYWSDLESIAAWRRNGEHVFAQRQGQERWYAAYKTRVCRVERDYGFELEAAAVDGTVGENAPGTLSHLARREVQAPLAACLIREFAGVVGEAKALAAAERAIRADAAIAGRALAEGCGGNGLGELAHVVREVWAAQGALELRMLQENAHALDFDVTRCRYVEMYRRLGLEKFGGCLSCSRDAAFAEGFNPRIRLTRTRTIMQGDAVCDFRFRFE